MTLKIILILWIIVTQASTHKLMLIYLFNYCYFLHVGTVQGVCMAVRFLLYGLSGECEEFRA